MRVSPQYIKSSLVSFCRKLKIKAMKCGDITGNLMIHRITRFYIFFQPLTVLVRGVGRVTHPWKLRGWGVSMTTTPPHWSGSTPTTHRPSLK